jgi:DICT domain-containing protein
LNASSQLIEKMARRSGKAAVLLSTYGQWKEYLPVSEVYEKIAEQAALVAVYAPDAPLNQSTSIRISQLGVDDPMQEEWCTILLSPHQSAALIARRLEDADLFECIVTYQRDRVFAAAQALMARLT